MFGETNLNLKFYGRRVPTQTWCWYSRNILTADWNLHLSVILSFGKFWIKPDHT